MLLFIRERDWQEKEWTHTGLEDRIYCTVTQKQRSESSDWILNEADLECFTVVCAVFWVNYLFNALPNFDQVSLPTF